MPRKVTTKELIELGGLVIDPRRHNDTILYKRQIYARLEYPGSAERLGDIWDKYLEHSSVAVTHYTNIKLEGVINFTVTQDFIASHLGYPEAIQVSYSPLSFDPKYEQFTDLFSELKEIYTCLSFEEANLKAKTLLKLHNELHSIMCFLE